MADLLPVERMAERLGLRADDLFRYGPHMAKTHSSLSDNPRLRGRPKDFEITVEEIQINAGAGFLVVLTGDIIRMPGLPRKPREEEIDLVDGEVVGIR